MVRKISAKEQKNLDELFSKQEQLTRKFLIELILGQDELVLGLANASGQIFDKPERVYGKDGSYEMVGPVTDEHLKLAPAYDYLYKWLVLTFGERSSGQATIDTSSPINALEFLEKAASDNIFGKLTKDYGVKISKRAKIFFENIKKNQSDQNLQALLHSDIDTVNSGSVKSQSTTKKSKTNKGRPRFPYSATFKDEVIKLHKKNISKKDIPYRATITKILNPDAPNQGKVIDEAEYKKTYKHAYSTVYKYTTKAISD